MDFKAKLKKEYKSDNISDKSQFELRNPAVHFRYFFFTVTSSSCRVEKMGRKVLVDEDYYFIA